MSPSRASLPRLSLATLPSAEGLINTRVLAPKTEPDKGPIGRDLVSVGPEKVSIGIVHLGIGAFHRAHQAVYTEDAAAATGERCWGILGVTGRSDAVVRQLRPQDCLYGVLTKDVADTSLRLIGSVRDVAWPGRDSERVVARLANPETHLATLTITEKGYCRAADGTVDVSRPGVRHDLAIIARELAGDQNLGISKTPLGLLVRGLTRRFVAGGAPFTVVPCDNLVGNGAMVEKLVTSMVSLVGEGSGGIASRPRDRLLSWLQTSVTFPSTMVDRITPATTAADQQQAEQLLGLQDEALVVAEPFTQWVIEDRFAGPRPAWEKAGAILTDDVSPYERAKLRILNASHSLLAYLGALKGYPTIAEAAADPVLRAAAVKMVSSDILPTLEEPAGLCLEQYGPSVLARFANPKLAHTTVQVAMDGSQKLPNRILGTVADRLAVGETPLGLALSVAAWITFISSTLAAGGPILDDPLAERLQTAVGPPDALSGDPAAAVERLQEIGEVFSTELRDSVPFRQAIVAQLGTVRELTERT